MKLTQLADAILDGSQGMEQATGVYIARDYATDEIYAVCALGAVKRAATPDREGLISDRDAVKYFGVVPRSPHYRCPIEGCDRGIDDVEAIIIHLNDGHRWTFQQIADWVREQDPR